MNKRLILEDTVEQKNRCKQDSQRIKQRSTKQTTVNSQKTVNNQTTVNAQEKSQIFSSYAKIYFLIIIFIFFFIIINEY
jgi:hypothetical protein